MTPTQVGLTSRYEKINLEAMSGMSSTGTKIE